MDSSKDVESSTIGNGALAYLAAGNVWQAQRGRKTVSEVIVPGINASKEYYKWAHLDNLKKILNSNIPT